MLCFHVFGQRFFLSQDKNVEHEMQLCISCSEVQRGKAHVAGGSCDSKWEEKNPQIRQN